MMALLIIRLGEQIPSGKNHVWITRTGRRYPAARFARWRASAYAQVRAQLVTQPNWREWPRQAPMALAVYYRPLDRRRRDVPGMLDALLHLLERAEVIQDDAQVISVSWTPAPPTQVSCVMMTIQPREAAHE